MQNKDNDELDLVSLAIKWLSPKPTTYLDGTTSQTTNTMGGETDWFLLPHSFGAVIGKKLVEQKAAGLPWFNEEGYARMIKWLVEMEHLDVMTY